YDQTRREWPRPHRGAKNRPGARRHNRFRHRARTRHDIPPPASGSWPFPLQHKDTLMTIEKILIVDDEILVRNFLAETLRRKNFDVATAENGTKAINLLKDTSYDLVITDMKMPDLTGIDVLKKAKELNPSTVVVIVTAFGSIENAVEAMRLGAFN